MCTTQGDPRILDGLEMDELDRIRQRKMQQLTERASKGSAAELMGETFKVTDADFEAQLSKHELILVDFWAPWCGPCRMVAPIIEDLAQAYAGRVAFGKLNTDENPQTALRFRVMSIPTMILFKEGRPVDMMVGAAPRQQIEAMMRKHLT